MVVAGVFRHAESKSPQCWVSSAPASGFGQFFVQTQHGFSLVFPKTPSFWVKLGIFQNIRPKELHLKPNTCT